MSMGFTLVEIMMVVALLGLLTLFALPNIRQAHQESLRKTCQTERALLAAAIEQWALDNPTACADAAATP